MSALDTLRHQGQRFWLQRSRRERQFLSVAAVVLTLGIAWGLVWEPAQAARARLTRGNAVLSGQVLLMQSLQKEADSLRARARLGGRTPENQMKGRLEAALSAQGLKGQQIDVDKQQARLAFEAPFETGLAVADAIRQDTHWSLSRVRFEATPVVGVVRAQMTWIRP